MVRTGNEPIYPDFKAQEAFEREREQQEKALQQRLQDSPHKAAWSELLFAVGVVIVFTFVGLAFFVWLGAIVWTWIKAEPRWVQGAAMVFAAFSLGLFGYALRELAKASFIQLLSLASALLAYWASYTRRKKSPCSHFWRLSELW